MLRTIHLHGSLGARFGKEHRLDVENIFQLMGALESRLGVAFKEAIRVGKWHIFDGAKKKGNDRSEETLSVPLSKRTFHIFPVIEGRSAAFRIVIGVVLMVASVFVPALAPYAVQVFAAGFSLTVGGITELLTKPKGMDKRDQLDEGKSSIFNSVRNVTTQGGPIPLIYGRVRRASSVVISADFASENTG